MRLIDADALIEKAYILQEPNGFIHSVVTERQIVKAPTIDAEPVKHGAWIEDGYNDNPFVCSYCGHEGCYSGNFNNKQYYYTNYCPNCGARMDGE